MVGDMVPEGVWDGWEAALVGLAENRDFANIRKKGTGAAFAIGVTREQALAAHAELLQDLRAFRDQADADLAALLHEEMRDCLRRYEERKQEAGRARFSRPADQGARPGAATTRRSAASSASASA